jgi:hypothetical protein
LLFVIGGGGVVVVNTVVDDSIVSVGGRTERSEFFIVSEQV